MKAFNKENMMQYMETLSLDEDEAYGSPQGVAQEFVENFEKWLETKDLPKITLPVRAEGYHVYDASGENVAVCFNTEMARALVVQLNAGYTPTDEDRSDSEALALSNRVVRKAMGKPKRKIVRGHEEDEITTALATNRRNQEEPKTQKKGR